MLANKLPKGKNKNKMEKKRDHVQTKLMETIQYVKEVSAWGITKNLQKTWSRIINEAAQDLDAALGAPQGQMVNPGAR